MRPSGTPPGAPRRESQQFQQWPLLAPLALFFALFVFAPLALLAFISVHTGSDLNSIGATQY